MTFGLCNFKFFDLVSTGSKAGCGLGDPYGPGCTL